MVQVEKLIWLTSPDKLKKIDFTDAESISDESCLSDPNLDMSESGWVLLGKATITFHDMVNHSTAALEAVNQIDKAIEGLRAEAEAKINGFLRVKQELLCLEAPSHD